MKKKTSIKNLLSALVVFTVISISSTARAEWQFGIGTGLMAMNAEGDMGFQVMALDPPAPIQFDMKLDPEDFNDYMESAIGFGGFASDGKWMILYSFSNLKLEGSDTITPSGPVVESASFSTEFDMTSAELVVGYPVYHGDSLALKVYGGVRYTGHELEGEVSVTTPTQTLTRSRKIDEDWIDGLVGIMADVRLAEKWNWNTRLDGGWGGSEGTYFVTTGVAWRFHEHWSATLYGRYMAVDFENNSKGDDDWYLYDVDESGVGLNIMFIW